MTTVAPNFSELAGVLTGKSVFVVAFGTSLRDFDWSLLKDKYTICVNGAIAHVPEASFHIFSDKALLNKYKNIDYPKHTMLVCQQYTADLIMNMKDYNVSKDRVYSFRRKASHVLNKIKPDDGCLYMSRTVATPATMLAWKLGADPIYIMGHDAYDLKGVTYADGAVQKKQKKDTIKDLEEGRILRQKHVIWGKQNEKLKKWFKNHGSTTKIYNLSEHSTVTAWEKKSVDEVFGKVTNET